MIDFGKFMSDKSYVNRWFILKVALIGGFCGAVLAYIFLLAGFIK